METKKHKLTLNFSPMQMKILERYRAATGMNYTEAFKCWIMNLPDAGDVDGEAELTTLIAKLQAKRARMQAGNGDKP